jgi:hypothetical protein
MAAMSQKSVECVLIKDGILRLWTMREMGRGCIGKKAAAQVSIQPITMPL